MPNAACAYGAILMAARALGWPKHFRDDLHVHDCMRLHMPDAPEQFVWVVHQSGTLLLDAGMSAQSRAAYVAHLSNEYRDGRARGFWWDGHHLAEFEGWEKIHELMRPFEAQKKGERGGY